MSEVVNVLSKDEINYKLKNGWSVNGLYIQKQYIFNSFLENIDFINHVAKIAEMLNHHPDLDIRYKKLLIKTSTHSEGGITQKDFDLAEKIDEIC